MVTSARALGTGHVEVSFAPSVNGPRPDDCSAFGTVGLVGFPSSGSTDVNAGELLVTPGSDEGGAFSVIVDTSNSAGQSQASAFMLSVLCPDR
jgi:hypothetical protein